MFSLCYQLAAKTTGKVRLQSIRNLCEENDTDCFYSSQDEATSYCC